MQNQGSKNTIKRKELVGKLNDVCLKAFSAASKTAKMRGNPYVELVHFVEQLILSERADFAILLQAAEVDEAQLSADVTRAADALPRGSTSVEEFSDHLFRAIQDAWTFGSLEFNEEQVRSAYILLAAMQSSVLEALFLKISLEFEKIDPVAMSDQLDELMSASLEGAAGAAEPKAKAAPGGQTALDQFATNLTQRAKDGLIDPIVGRDPEIRQIIDVLMRRRQNNPILTGEAGVGKTAVVEGFALRLARGDVPPQLKNVELHMLDVGLMQAGASMKGEFEKRLKQVIDEVQSSETPIIMFIDEAHTLIGAGGAAGTGDAANLLKPALARGELRTVAATTWSEYKEHIEKDPALTRRFQVIKIDEPDEDKAILMLRGLASVLEAHHRVEILDDAIKAAVNLSHRYIPARQLPDKAISLLDTACARVGISQHATPAQVEDLERREAALLAEEAIIAREANVGIDTADRAEVVEAALTETGKLLSDANRLWECEKSLVDDILDLRKRLRQSRSSLEEGESSDEGSEDIIPELSDEDRQKALSRLRAKMAELNELQGENPLIMPSVDSDAVASIAQDWTGIPVGRMMTSETEKALGLASILSDRVVGQDHAMEMITNRIQTTQAGLDAPNKPVGVFMLCGPSGVGKTETALALAETLYGGEQNLISINMSEFQEAHTVSTLKGSPPGYVGYGKGGVLTEAVRRRPYSVVLLDEVEKAHPDVHEIFFQVFDKGLMDDSEGQRINFTNTLILLTSNVGSQEIMDLTNNGKTQADPEMLNKALREPLLAVFPAALLGRIVTIPYYPLSDAMIEAITGHQLGMIKGRLAEQHGAELKIGDTVMDLIKSRCTEIESGGRMIDAILTNTLLPELSRHVLMRRLDGEPFLKVMLGAADDKFTYAFE